MSEVDILQPIDKSKNNAEDIMFRQKTEREKFIAKLRELESQYTKEHKPFSYRAAKYIFEEQQDALFKKKGRFVADKVENVKIDLDLNKFGDIKRFNVLSKKDAIENKLIDGIRTAVKVGEYVEYQDKEFGNKVIVFEPNNNPTNRKDK